MKRLLITGAGGNLGRIARARLGHLAEILRLSDIAGMGPAGPGEEVIPCDLGDRAAVADLVAGCDGILHLGGVSVERPWDEIQNANITGVYNLYEAARAHGMPRIFFASSNHTIGFYEQDQVLDVTDPMRPDGLYGVSKCFGEGLARLYHDKFGQESALIRIGSCFEKPRDRRMLATWMSPDDFVRLVECVFRVPMLGCPVIWGVSDNDEGWWNTETARLIGWRPQDNAEDFRAEIEAAAPRPAPDAPESRFQGGKFCAEPIHQG
ncbi:NAD(P)-dependent oxidoreductase [Pseudooceanicola sp. CBS1P-1]|uniref:NAD-dependent epimerase/dehydratase family protein n=2 Tax=Paracoccaceae TaxID=31989 RepID=A0A6L7G990_9RHOB|nr:NAD(P)-dependent oxidoreductase [Pseudooceanicola endophyticus]MXN19870.1 NAD-dependent epimerase/dehydratase family protein [Pseudooceanicola albus]